jgi:hypothetical protein
MNKVDQAQKGHLKSGGPLLAHTTDARRRNASKNSNGTKSLKKLPPAPALTWSKKR